MNESVACIAYKNNKVFIAKRKAGGDMGEKWEFPGGKVEEGEDFTSAIKREMLEEFNVSCSVLNKIGQVNFFHKNKERSLFAFQIELPHDGIEKKFDLTEHTEYKWVDFSLIPSLDFVDSDLKLYPIIIDYFKN